MISSTFKSALAAVALAVSVGSVVTTDAFAWDGHFGGGHFGGHQHFGGGYRRYGGYGGGYGYRDRPTYSYSSYSYHGTRPAYRNCAYGRHYSPFLHECIDNFRRF